MIKLETAVKLKEAGLEWEPQIYDFYESDNGIENVSSLSFNDGKVSRVDKWNWRPGKYYLSRLIWLLRLDQLLAEIEKQGFNGSIGSDWYRQDTDKKYCMGLFDINGMYVQGQFYGKSPEEAAAKALLWIMEKNDNAEEGYRPKINRGWTCIFCGFLNLNRYEVCERCGTTRHE